MKKDDKSEKITSLITRGVEQVTVREHLEQALKSGSKLRVKFGIDPTGSKIHIGRAIVLWKLREFQRLGHTIVLIIGDFTAQIGDPSDKLSKRPFLTPGEIKKNLKGYLAQIGTIIDVKQAEVRYNSEWLKKLNFQEIAELAESFSVQQMIERRNFKDRWDKHEEISLREMLYPLMQGYDSVAVKADVELGGSDQLFNLFAGRKIQEYYNLRPQDIMTVQMLDGLDGRKMSTSWGNVINIDDDPQDMFGKVMSMSDSQITSYFRLATDASEEEIDRIELDLNQGTNPKMIKVALAERIVARYHGDKSALAASTNFESIFSKKDIKKAKLPPIMVDSGSSPTVLDLVMMSRIVASKSEARRLIEQGAVQYEDATVRDWRATLDVTEGASVKIGKKGYFRITLSKKKTL